MENYASYDFLPDISYNIISDLIDNPEAEIIWKLLKYRTKDDWQAQNLTKADKRKLIYDGSEDETKFAIFFDSGMDESITEERVYLRIYPYFCVPKNPYLGTVDVAFEFMCHYKINTLSNYTTRVDTIISALLKCLNGKDIGGVGKLFFNTQEGRLDKIQNFGQPPMKAKILIMSVNVG